MGSVSHIDRCEPEFVKLTNRFRAGEWLFHNCYCLYSPIYTLYKTYRDRFTLSLIRKNIPDGAVALDIGANVGVFSALFAEIVGPTGRVHSFEPESLNFKRLRERTRGMGNMSIYPLAVADKSGSVVLYKSSALNVDHRLYNDGGGRETTQIEAVAIDDLFRKSKIDFIKIDIQGFEYKALLGMQETLKHNPDVILYLELWPYGLKKAGTSAEEILNLVERLGFQIRIVDLKHKRLEDIRFTPKELKGYETQPSVDFDIWCDHRRKNEKP